MNVYEPDPAKRVPPTTPKEAAASAAEKNLKGYDQLVDELRGQFRVLNGSKRIAVIRTEKSDAGTYHAWRITVCPEDEASEGPVPTEAP